LTTTGDLSACKSKQTLIQLLTVNRPPLSESPPRSRVSAPRASLRLSRGFQPLERVSTSLEGPSPSSEPPPRSRLPLGPRYLTCSPTGALNALTRSGRTGQRANPHHADPLTPPGNQAPALCGQLAAVRPSWRCACTVRSGRRHFVTLCYPLPSFLHVAPLEKGRRRPRGAYAHRPNARPGQCRDAR
jgi:hypothetical protein